MAPDRSKSPADPDRTPDRKGHVRLVGLGVAAALLVAFAVLNRRTVTVDFWVHQSRAPLVVVILVAGLLGVVVAALAQRHKSRRG
jgi:uncharacterized integral membrane protein